MARIILSAYRAERKAGYSGLSIIFDLRNGDPFPSKTVEIKRAADAAAAFSDYKAEAEKSGLPLALSMRIAAGDRSPPGFKALTAGPYVTVNV